MPGDTRSPEYGCGARPCGEKQGILRGMSTGFSPGQHGQYPIHSARRRGARPRLKVHGHPCAERVAEAAQILPIISMRKCRRISQPAACFLEQPDTDQDIRQSDICLCPDAPISDRTRQIYSTPDGGQSTRQAAAEERGLRHF